MNKFNVGDVVVRVEDFDTTGTYDCCTGKPVKITGIIGDYLSFSSEDGGHGWYERFFELHKPAFNPLKDPWYILTPTKEAFDDAVAWAKVLGINTYCLPVYTESTFYIRYFGNHSIVPKYGSERIFKEFTFGHKQITLTKSISYEYKIAEGETEEQKEVKKKAEVIFQDEINAVRIEMEALAKRLKDLEG